MAIKYPRLASVSPPFIEIQRSKTKVEKVGLGNRYEYKVGKKTYLFVPETTEYHSSQGYTVEFEVQRKENNPPDNQSVVVRLMPGDQFPSGTELNKSFKEEWEYYNGIKDSCLAFGLAGVEPGERE